MAEVTKGQIKTMLTMKLLFFKKKKERKKRITGDEVSAHNKNLSKDLYSDTKEK